MAGSAINNSLFYGVFSDNAKITLLSALDNGISNEVPNFRPVWSEKDAEKRYLKADKNTFLSPFLSAYRKKEELQHVFIRLVEK